VVLDSFGTVPPYTVWGAMALIDNSLGGLARDD
jgi:hypothetical protein